MSISVWVSRRRSELGFSRRYLSDETGIKNGRIYAIDKGMGRAVESQELTALEAILGPYRSNHDAVTQGETTSTEPDVVPIETPESSAEITSTTVEPKPLQIDWSALQARADDVSRHDIDKISQLGPSLNGDYMLVSNSELRTFQDCRRKWWLAWYRGLEKRKQSPLGALAIGDRIHRALQRMYVPPGLPPVDPKTALEQVVTEDWTKLVRSLGETSAELASLHREFEKEVDLERAMIAGYVEWVEETGADDGLTVIASEQYLEAELDLPSAYPATKIIGKLDARLLRECDGVRIFIDHKTVGSLTKPIRTLPLNTQMKHYILLEWMNITDNSKRCTSGIWNMLRKVKRTATAKPPFYGRHEVKHSSHSIGAYLRHVQTLTCNIHNTRASLDHNVNHHDVVPPNPSDDCTWKCPFLAICPMFDDGSRVEDMIEQNYRKGEPLSYYQQETDNAEFD